MVQINPYNRNFARRSRRKKKSCLAVVLTPVLVIAAITLVIIAVRFKPGNIGGGDDQLQSAARTDGDPAEVSSSSPLLPDLTAEVSRAAYRMVQEILTNASKHGTGSVSLKLGAAPGRLTIEAVNVRADEPADSHQGYGLIGLRERAASVGGTVTTQIDGRLFWTRASLPAEWPTPPTPSTEEQP